MTWTRSQQIALATIPKFTSMLSIAGSTWIIIEVLVDRRPGFPRRLRGNERRQRQQQQQEQQYQRKRDRSYDRLLLFMSFYDIFESVWNFASTWPIPAGTTGIFGAAGNTGTCVAQGFFLQLGLAIPIYNAGLALYFLLSINYHVTDATLHKWIEPSMHAVAFSFPAGTALACVFLDQFNNANLWCWIAPFPAGCRDSWTYGPMAANCTRGDNAWIYRWCFYFVPLWLCILFACVAMILVYAKVRQGDQRTLVYRRPERSFGSNSFDRSVACSAGPFPERRCRSWHGESRVELSSEVSPVGDEDDVKAPADTTSGDKRPSVVRFAGLDGSDCDHEAENVPVPSSSRSAPTSPAAAVRQSVGASVGAVAAAAVAAENQLEDMIRRGGSIGPYFSRKWEAHNRNNPRSTEVFGQAMWYLGAFLITHCWSTTNRILQQTRGGTFFPLIVIHSFFDPLQGFLNFLVYRRPRYLRYRKDHPDMTRLQALRLALRWTFLKHRQSRSDRDLLSSSHRNTRLDDESFEMGNDDSSGPISCTFTEMVRETQSQRGFRLSNRTLSQSSGEGAAAAPATTSSKDTSVVVGKASDATPSSGSFCSEVPSSSRCGVFVSRDGTINNIPEFNGCNDDVDKELHPQSRQVDAHDRTSDGNCQPSPYSSEEKVIVFVNSDDSGSQQAEDKSTDDDG